MSGIHNLAVLLEAFGMPIPFHGIERFEDFDRIRSIYKASDFLERCCPARCQDLDCDVSKGCCFGRPGQDSPPGSIGGHLIEQTIFRSSANHSNLVDSPSNQVLEMVEDQAIFESQTLHDRSDVASYAIWRRLMSLRTESIDRSRHVVWPQERRMVRIHKKAEG